MKKKIKVSRKRAIDKIKSMRSIGMPFQEIGNALGVTKQRAHAIYKKYIGDNSLLTTIPEDEKIELVIK